MNGLEIIYCVGSLAIGVIIGMVIELMIDSETIRELQNDNRKLKLELEQERKRPEVIEIVDKWNVGSTEQNNEVDFSQKW